VKASHFSEDIQEILALLAKHQVKYLIVGGEAVIYYGHARLTGDIDLFYEASLVFSCIN
jgi:predicted nucleotidyltransferase